MMELPASHQFPNHPLSADCFLQPQITTMAISRSTSVTTTTTRTTIITPNSSGPLPQLPRPLMMRSSSIGTNPMMRMTLPKAFGDDPLASPVNSKPLPASFNDSHYERTVRSSSSSSASSSSSSGFSSVFSRRRESSMDKKPPMIPSLRRTSSVPVKASNLLSKMATLKRAVSGGKSRAENDGDDSDDPNNNNARESLLMLLRVPDVQRSANVPLMMASTLDY